MSIMKVIEVLAQSDKSWEDAANNAVMEASKTIRNIKSVYIQETTAEVTGNKISQFRVNAKISFEHDK